MTRKCRNIMRSGMRHQSWLYVLDLKGYLLMVELFFEIKMLVLAQVNFSHTLSIFFKTRQMPLR